MWYGSAMIVLSLLLVAGTVLKQRAPGKPVEWRDVGRAMTCWVAFVVAIVLMKFLGFIVAFAALTWFMAAIMASQRQRIAIPLAVGMSVFFYLLFAVALDVSLPTGIFG
jgi:putative tricarboxylic transport membrane protein